MKRKALDSRGFTLIEVLITMVLSLIVIGMVYSMYTSLQTFYSNERRLLARQQNSRSAMFFLTRDLRMAGFGGAGGTVSFFDPALGAGRPLNMLNLIKGGDCDALVMFSGDPAAVTRLTLEMTDSDDEMRVEDVTGFAVGDHVMITDGERANLLEVTGVDAVNKVLEHAAGTGINPNGVNIFPSTYGAQTPVYRFRSVKFSVSDEQLHYETGRSYDPAWLAGVAPGAGSDILASNIRELDCNYVFEDLGLAPAFNDADMDETNDYSDIRSMNISMRAVARDLKKGDRFLDLNKVTRIRNLGL